MRLSNYFLFLLILQSLNLYGQYENGLTIPDTTSLIIDLTLDQVKYASTITPKDLKSHLSIIASDNMEGRETGTSGNDLAASYLANQIKKLGISPLKQTPGYFQSIDISNAKWVKTEISIYDQPYRHLWDYLVFPDMNKSSQEEEEEILFLGFGIHDSRYSDYEGIKVKGKSIIIFEGEPKKEDGIFWISGDNNSSFWTIENKLKIAQRKGVKRTYIISNDIKKLLLDNSKKVLRGTTYFGNLNHDSMPIGNHIYISADMAQTVLGESSKEIIERRNGINHTGSSSSLKVKTDISINFERKVTMAKSQNVAAYVEGKNKKEEVLIVSAHYDHLGKRGESIYNGADDNGSGSTAILEILEAFVAASSNGKGPERSILFLWLTSEEKGLKGSEYYTENPLFPFSSTIANVNVDMIGRSDKKHQDDPNYIYVIGSDRLSTDLHIINEEVNEKYTDLVLDYQYNDADDPNRFYFRSDHYNFAKKGIPAIFFFSGVHEDYHRTSDTEDKIMYNKYQKVCQLIFHNIWELANRENRIKVDKSTNISQ